MRLTLAPHPETPCDAITRISVEAMRSGQRLRLRYRMEGDMAKVVLGERGARKRADELWKHSCFEAFIGTNAGYAEINLSPSNRWAAYTFTGYRSGMTVAEGFELIELEDNRAADLYALDAELDLTDLTPCGCWSVGLSAVVELANGDRCFWALRHASGKPDFHHPDAFALSLHSMEAP
jgi:hypothetical protein